MPKWGFPVKSHYERNGVPIVKVFKNALWTEFRIIFLPGNFFTYKLVRHFLHHWTPQSCPHITQWHFSNVTIDIKVARTNITGAP